MKVKIYIIITFKNKKVASVWLDWGIVVVERCLQKNDLYVYICVCVV